MVNYVARTLNPPDLFLKGRRMIGTSCVVTLPIWMWAVVLY